MPKLQNNVSAAMKREIFALRFEKCSKSETYQYVDEEVFIVRVPLSNSQANVESFYKRLFPAAAVDQLLFSSKQRHS